MNSSNPAVEPPMLHASHKPLHSLPELFCNAFHYNFFPYKPSQIPLAQNIFIPESTGGDAKFLVNESMGPKILLPFFDIFSVFCSFEKHSRKHQREDNQSCHCNACYEPTRGRLEFLLVNDGKLEILTLLTFPTFAIISALSILLDFGTPILYI